MRLSYLLFGISFFLLSACDCKTIKGACYIGDPIDREPPTIKIDAPAGDIEEAPHYAILVWVADDASFSEDVLVDFYLDNEVLSSQLHPDSTGAIVSTLTTEVGPHTLLVVAKDESGAKSEETTSEFEITALQDTATP